MSSGGITGFPIGGIVSVVPGAGMTRTPSMTGFQQVVEDSSEHTTTTTTTC